MMNEWKKKEEIERLKNSALGRVIFLQREWNRHSLYHTKGVLKEALSYIDQAMKLEEEKNDKQSVKTNPGIENNTASEQSKKGYWGAIGAYCFDKE